MTFPAHRRCVLPVLLGVLFGGARWSNAQGGAAITIVNADAAGTGFNDPTPAAPVGGNGGATLGQQRMNVFQAAANKWGASLSSPIPIRIRAAWSALPCNSTSGVLGSAGAAEVFRDFDNAPRANHWYAKALANKLFGADLDPTSPDINANFNVNLGKPSCLPGITFYLGLDNNHGTNIDLVAVLEHEFGHGLGFQTFTDGQTGAELGGSPSIWDDFLLDNLTNKTWLLMTDAERVVSATNTGHLVWNGGAVTAAIPQILQPLGSSFRGADATGRAMMYAPNPIQLGSSVSHWSNSMFPNQLLEPAYQLDLTHELAPPVDLTLPLMSDIGWTLASGNKPALTIQKTHAGGFNLGQADAVYTIVVSNTGAPTAGPVTVTEAIPPGLTLVSMAGTGWTCPPGGVTCTRGESLAAGAAYPAITVTVNVSPTAQSPQLNTASVSGGGSATASATDPTAIGGVCAFSLGAAGASVAVGSGSGAFSVTAPAGCAWTAVSNAAWLTVTSASGNGNGTVGYSFAANPGTLPRFGTITVGGQPFTLTQVGTSAVGQALRFVPVTPCRIADTRSPAGPFGGPALAAAISRDFNIPASACGIPASALAFSLNVTVVPLGPLGFLSVWPAGQSQPVVSTVNSGDGRIKANAAIVPASVNGAITVFATNPTHVILDINGYFVLASAGQNLAFYPITPCRLVDTRIGTGTFAGPALAPNATRTFPVLGGICNLPATARAYAANMTVVPTGPLGFLSVWPAGQPQPGSSTINAPTGTVTANMAIIPAGTGGGITVIATNPTELIIDITGYFAPPGAGSLDFHTAIPCRVLDTRGAGGQFGGPTMGAAQSRGFLVPASGCSVPATAKAYSLNATVVPPGSLGFLTLWGEGPQPAVSTLNAGDGSIVANAALVPSGAGGMVTAFTSNPSHLILDLNGYFQ